MLNLDVDTKPMDRLQLYFLPCPELSTELISSEVQAAILISVFRLRFQCSFVVSTVGWTPLELESGWQNISGLCVSRQLLITTNVVSPSAMNILISPASDAGAAYLGQHLIHTRVKDSFSVRAGVKLGSAEKMQLGNSVKVTAAVQAGVRRPLAS